MQIGVRWVFTSAALQATQLRLARVGCRLQIDFFFFKSTGDRMRKNQFNCNEGNLYIGTSFHLQEYLSTVIAYLG